MEDCRDGGRVMKALLESVYECVGNGGEFFTQSVFAVSASMFFSHKVSEFLMIPRREQLEKLKKVVRDELSTGRVTESKNQHYTQILEELKRKDAELAECVKNTIKGCRKVAFCCLLLSFLLLVTDWGKYAGFLPLLSMYPFVIARKKLKAKQKEVEDFCNTKEEVLNAIRIAYGSQASKDSADLLGELEQRKVDDVMERRRKERLAQMREQRLRHEICR